MTGDEQQPIGGSVAGVTTPTPTPTGTGNQDTTDWKAEAETWKSRYTGASTKINEYDKSVKDWQQKYAAKEAEAEGLRAGSTNELTEWKTKHQTLEQQAAAQAKELAKYERKEKVRSLIHSEFKDLANDFEADPIYQSGILSAAELMDEPALKESLKKSSELRKGRAAEAIDAATSGATPTPPTSGSGGGEATEAQIQEQIKKLDMGDPAYDQKRQTLMDKWRKARQKQS